MDNLKKILYLLSKTDPDIINDCPKSSQYNQIALGLAVLITGILAFFSGSFLVYTIFKNSFLSIIIGFIYSIIIVTIDREIVSAKDKNAALLRIPLAIIIGLFISIPLELKLFEGRIDQQLNRQSQVENKQAFDDVKKIQGQYNERKTSLESEISERRKTIEEYSKNMEAEAVGRVIQGRTGIPGYGPAFKEAQQVKMEAEKLLVEAKDELKNLNDEYATQMQRANIIYEEEKINPTFDLLSRYETLETIKNNSAAAMFIAWLMRLFFIMVEVVPAILRLFVRYDEYLALLETRTSINIQRIHSVGNEQMGEIEKEPMAVPSPTIIQYVRQNPLTS